MKKLKTNTIWFLFWILYLEIIYRIFIIKDLFSINTISIIIFNIPLICILTLLTTIFKEKINTLLSISLSFLIMLFTLAQIVYFKFYTSVFSFFSLTTGTGQVMEFYEMIIKIILSIWYIFILILTPYIIYLVLLKKKKITCKQISLKRITYIISTLATSLLCVFLIITFDNKDLYSLNNLIYNTHAPMLTINKIGLSNMELLDIFRYTFGFNEKVIIDNNEKKEYSIDEYNILDLNIEENDNTKDIIEYINSIEPTSKNEYTGLFKGKNLIFITAESFDTIAIDKDITPTLYKMYNNSISFTNYYQPLFPISTSDGEYQLLNSLIPTEGKWSFSSISNNTMNYSIGNMFKKEGYNTYAFHNNDYTYYHRNTSYPKIGLNYLACGNGLEKRIDCSKWPSSDIDLIKSIENDYQNNTPFMTYILTVSGHLSYSYLSNNIAIKNKELVKDLNYSKSINAYYATQIELDKALEELLKELEENNLLDDTLIIISPDHYPYGLLKNEINEVSDIDRSDKFENFHTSLIMYNPNINKTIINDTISGIDLLPTIYNLFGIKYDSRIYMGKDIFSNSDHLVIFSDRSWITNKGKYNSITSSFTKTTNEEVSQEYIDNINNEVYKKFTYSKYILENDFYSYIKETK